MKKVLIAAAAAAMVAACGQKGGGSAAPAAESQGGPVLAPDGGTACCQQTYTYEGVYPTDSGGVACRLVLRETSCGAVGAYRLSVARGKPGCAPTAPADSGTVVTLVGIPGDSAAVVYQLVSVAPARERTSFLAEGDSALALVGRDFKKAAGRLKCTLRKKP